MVGIVYITLLCPWQTLVKPEIVPAATGKGFTEMAKTEESLMPQLLLPFTLIFPETAEVPKLTVIEFVELAPVAPVGNVHTYEVALVMVGIVYITLLWPWQTLVKPEIVPAAAGNGFTVMAKTEESLIPQLLLPFTLILPETAAVP